MYEYFICFYLLNIFVYITYLQAPWSPRVGMGTVTQWYFDASSGETMTNSSERVVIAGG